MMVGIGKILRAVSGRDDGQDGRGVVVQRANRAAAANRLPVEESAAAASGAEGWARPEYGRYMATSPSVYAAVRLRAEAVTRPPLRVYRTESSGRRALVEPSHSVARLLERVNPGTPGPTCGAPPRSTCACGVRPSGPSSGARTASRSCGRCVPTAWR